MLAAIATVIAVAAISVPHEYVNSAFILAILLLAAAVGFLFYVPHATRMQSQSANLALIGPVGTLSMVLLVWSGFALVAALCNYVTASFAMDALTIGGFVVAWSLLKIASQVVTHAAEDTEKSSQHGTWQARVSGLTTLCIDEKMRQPVSRLAENIRYIARDSTTGAHAENSQIAKLIDTLETAIRDQDLPGTLAYVHQLETVLAQREQALKALRSKI
jgi:phage shock protein PspC (stress-responsive transcriptional regulator)